MDEAWSAFNSASAKLKQALPTKAGGGLETTYATAYQGLVRAGLAQQLKKRYR